MRLSPILLSVALLCACGQVMAAEARHMGPDGSGGTCPDTAAANTDRNSDDDTDNEAVAAPVRRPQKAKPAPTSHGNAGGNRSTAPRWHSFLPGMFR